MAVRIVIILIAFSSLLVKITILYLERVFVNLSQLRDISLTDGSQAFFDDWGKELIDIKVLAKYISSNSCKMLGKLIQKQYLEFDEWIAENQWIFNDELSNIVRTYFGV